MLKATMAKNPKFLSLHGTVESLNYGMDTNKVYFKYSDRGPSAKDVVRDLLAAQAPEQTIEPELIVSAAPAAPSQPVSISAPSPTPARADLGAGPAGSEVNVPPSLLT